MKSSKQEVIINHSAKNLYDIVLDIEKYPEFIPWCSSVNIRSKKKNSIIADLIVWYKFFMRTFTSDVRFNSKDLIIDVLYIDGPLKKLDTKWKFEEIENKKTKVYFEIKFEFRNFAFQKLSEIFFELIQNKMINCFKKRADEVLN